MSLIFPPLHPNLKTAPHFFLFHRATNRTRKLQKISRCSISAIMALPVRKARRKAIRKSSGEAFVIRLMLAALLLARKCSAWTTNNVVRTRPRSALFYSTTTTTTTTAAADSSSSNSSSQTKRAPTKFVDFPFAYRQEFELEIEKLTNRGWGIGRVSVAEQNNVEQSSAQVASPKTDTTELKKWVVMVE